MAAAPIPSTDVETACAALRGFSEPTRLQILTVLAEGERRVTDVVDLVGGSQGNISGHLRCLKDCGLVSDRRAGREVFYRIATDEVVDVLQSIERLVAVAGRSISLCPTSGVAR